jgi:hypothetical protein
MLGEEVMTWEGIKVGYEISDMAGMKITDLRDNEIYLLRKDVEQDKNLSYI